MNELKEAKGIPSPIPYLVEVPDPRASNRRYDWRMLFMLVLMGLGSGRTNIVAIAQWIQDQRDWLLLMGFGRGKTGRSLPAQATLYRFLWALEKEVEALERALKAWAKEVLRTLGQDPGLLEISLDGKHLKGSARGGVGDKAMVLVSAYLSGLGLSLWQNQVVGDEAVAGQQLVMLLGDELSEIGIPWVLTGDAGHTETQTARVILEKGDTTFLRSRAIRLS